MEFIQPIAITPSKSPLNDDDNHNCCHNNCAICLSPLKTPSGSCTTSCNHEFHYLCLQEAKLTKSECPLCRTALTPPIGTNSPMITVNLSASNAYIIPRVQRDNIVQRSRAARAAVQRLLETQSLGLQMHQQQDQQHELRQQQDTLLQQQ